MPSVWLVDLIYNEISYIHPDWWTNVPKLGIIYLRHNFIKSINLNSIPKSISQFDIAVNHLHHIPSLDAVHKHIPLRRRTFDMSRCNLTDIPFSFRVDTPLALILDYNDIHEFSDFLATSIEPNTYMNQASLRSNPLICSCKLRWLKLQHELQKWYIVDTCEDVVHGRVQRFHDIPLSYFLCIHNDSRICDAHCTCLGPSEADDILPTYVMCISQGLTEVPQLISLSAITLDMQDNVFHVLTFPLTGKVRLLKFLYLRKCQINEISPSAFHE